MTDSNRANSAQILKDWVKLEDLSSHLSQSGMEPGTIPDSEWQLIEQALNTLVNDRDWNGILRLRAIFTPLYARDTVTGLPALQLLDHHAIQAARYVGDKSELGHLLGSKGHNLHRQGYHQEAIIVFEESAHNYRETGKDFEALKSYYMTSLCYRAWGKEMMPNRYLRLYLNKSTPWIPGALIHCKSWPG